MSLRNYVNKVKNHFAFSQNELWHYLGFVLVLAIIQSWNQWGEEQFNFLRGLYNLLIAIVLAGITVFIHHAGQRLWGLREGYKTEQTTSIPLTGISLAICVLTNGLVKPLLGTGTKIEPIKAHRIGKFRYGTNLSELARIAAAGPVLNVAFAGIVKTLLVWNVLPESLAPLVAINLWYAFCNVLPIPPLDGVKIFFAWRTGYIFFATTLLFYAVLSTLITQFAFLASVLIGAVLAFLYHAHFE